MVSTNNVALCNQEQGKEMKSVKKIMILFCGLLVAACSTGKPLKSRLAEEIEFVPGNYRTILYGANYGDDLETVAFLDIEGDDYILKPFGADFKFTIQERMAGLEAFDTARKFVAFHRSFRNVEHREILAPTGQVIGYEIHPMYHSLEFGTDDPIVITYSLQEGNVVEIVVRLKEEVEEVFNAHSR